MDVPCGEHSWKFTRIYKTLSTTHLRTFDNWLTPFRDGPTLKGNWGCQYLAFWEHQLANIQKRTSEDGTTRYRVQVRLKGHPAQTATFDRLTDAKRWAQQTESAIREGRHFKTVEAKKHTLAEVVDRYVATVLPEKRPNTVATQRLHLDWWKEQLGAYSLAELTSNLIASHRDRLLAEPTASGEKRGPATVVRYLAALSHALTLATNEWGWLEDNPMRKVAKPREPRGRVRFLTPAERDRLLETCQRSRNPWLYPVVVVALSTGMREGEIMGLRWADVDFERRRVLLHETKNGERRAVPLIGTAVEVLRSVDRGNAADHDLLFPSKVNASKPMDLRTPWETALKHADIQDFRFHDLRHTAASYLAMSGASLAEIAEVLGHKTLSMVKRYAHLTEGHTASVLERMGSKFLS